MALIGARAEGHSAPYIGLFDTDPERFRFPNIKDMPSEYVSLSPSENYAREIDLLDATIQSLYGIGLKLQFCLELLDSSPGQVRSGIEGAIVNLDEIVEAFRGRIYQLH